MFTLIKKATLYTPQPTGVRDILVVDRVIAKIADHIELPSDLIDQTIHAEDKMVTPGLIDLHVHLLGGGGEGGFRTRTPEIMLSEIAKAGVTTVVGCLGTDDVSRRPETLLAKAMQLEEEGLSSYIYTGSYQLPPPTITGNVRKDIALIPKVVGIGELAISDHRSSQPTHEELCRLAAEARVGGLIGGKAGIVHVHVGSGPDRLDPLFRVVRETEIPITQFLPTHVTRTEALLEHAIEFAKQGGNIDITVAPANLGFSCHTHDAIRKALDAGVSTEQITLSSDSNGSIPIFDEQGRLVRLAVADIGSLFAELRTLVKQGFAMQDVLEMVTINPAKRVGIAAQKGRVQEGVDADLLFLNEDLKIESVMAKGRLLIYQGEIKVTGTFER